MDGSGSVRVTPVYGDTLTWGGYSSGYPWMVRGLSEVYGDTLTWGRGIAVDIHGWSGVCQSNSGVRGYSDMGGGYSSGYPWMVRGLSEVYEDTLTWGGIAVAIHGWSGDCQSNSGVRGYSDIGGEGGYSSGYPWIVPGLSE